MLAENSRGELIIVEIQNNRELSYFHRMLYGVSKAISEYIWKGDEYEKIKKLYSVNIVYFELGQGEDYVYRGSTVFTGIHTNDILKLSEHQREQFTYENAGDLFPEYYVIRVNEFNENAVTSLDEWISFLKTGEIPEDARAKGLAEARERLQEDRLSEEERKAYNAHMESVRYEKSVIQTSLIEGEAKGREKGRAEGRAEGKAEGKAEVVIASYKAGLPVETIAKITGLTTDRVSEIINYKK
jgi:predicted transposase/invertase (TIGR01784 family)